MWLRFTLRLVHSHRRWHITSNVIEIRFNVGSQPQKVVMHHTECDWNLLSGWFTPTEGDASHWMWLRFALRLVHSHRRGRITPNVIEIHFTVCSHSEKGTYHTKCDWDSLYCWFTLREGDASHQMWLRFTLRLVHSHRRWHITSNVIEIRFKVGSQPQKVVMHHTKCDWDSL